MGRTGRRVAVVAVAVAALVSACSGDDSDVNDDVPVTDPVETSESTTTEAPTTTEDPDAAVKAEVEEAYLAYWDAFLEIFANPNPENPLIDVHTTGATRTATLDGITQLLNDGRSIRPPMNPEHWAVTVLDIGVDGSEASVDACLIDGAQYYDNVQDTAINDDVVTKHLSATMRYESGLWKAASSEILGERDGIWDCGS